MRFAGLIAAIVVAAIAAVIVLRMTDAPPPAAAPSAVAQNEKEIPIYVAARPIPIGATITADMIVSQKWPEHLILPGFIRADATGQTIADKAVGSATTGPTSIIKSVARAPFQENEPILSSKLANPNDPNFLAATLPKGMRVITVVTNETEGLAGFVFPGDHVDVILTHDMDREKLEQSATTSSGAAGNSVEMKISKVPFKDPISETLLNNVTVLAVDQRASSDGATDKDGKLVIPRSVSLMVSQVDAQRLRLAEKVGTLTLSLRSLSDRDEADPATIVGAENITQYKMAKPEFGGGSSEDMPVTIYRGAPRDALGDSVPGRSAPASGPNMSTQQIPNHPTPAGR